MYDFATAITPAVIAFINSILGLVDPTTFIGGVITLALVAKVGIKSVGRLFRLARG